MKMTTIQRVRGAIKADGRKPDLCGPFIDLAKAERRAANLARHGVAVTIQCVGRQRFVAGDSGDADDAWVPTPGSEYHLWVPVGTDMVAVDELVWADEMAAMESA